LNSQLGPADAAFGSAAPPNAHALVQVNGLRPQARVDHPVIIQGGMGIGVSSWQLAGAVGRAGGLGVVSGVALDTILARRLQDGDPDGHLRRALAQFPDPEVAESVLARYFIAGGRREGRPYRPVPHLTLQPHADWIRLAVASAFVEVYLAKEAAAGGSVGINFLEKIQLATPAAAYGAMLAGVDFVLVGAGIPVRMPWLLDTLSRHEPLQFPIDVVGAGGSRYVITLDPSALLGPKLPAVSRPIFLAIVSSNTLATYLARDAATRPDGFVVEGAIAGGHNAPPRGTLQVDDDGEPLYGPRDVVDPGHLSELGLPFWVAGGYGRPEQVAAARAFGASGVQVGTAFALARESGLAPAIRQQLLANLRDEGIVVRTDVLASPTGFPFKIAQLPNTLSDPIVYEGRRRLCNLGYLRTPYVKTTGEIGYRCPAEPPVDYVRKGGERADTVSRICLCNGLMATIGLGQLRRVGRAEPPVVTLGADLSGARVLLERHPGGWSARDVVEYLEEQPELNA